MKLKLKKSLYAKKKFVISKKCGKCKRTIMFEKMYIGHNGPCKFFFCTECINSEEAAKEASLIKRPSFSSIKKD